MKDLKKIVAQKTQVAENIYNMISFLLSKDNYISSKTHIHLNRKVY